MAADYGKLTADLARFYDFADKTVLYVGAGGRQLLDRAAKPKKLIRIDPAAAPTEETIRARFEDIDIHGDVAYFEFCLHETDDPLQALHHARISAPEIVVFDHSPGSPWSFLAAEEDKVRRSAAAMEQFGIRRRETFSTVQRFHEGAELLEKMASQGPLALERARKFTGATLIEIPMPYELVLL